MKKGGCGWHHPPVRVVSGWRSLGRGGPQHGQASTTPVWPWSGPSCSEPAAATQCLGVGGPPLPGPFWLGPLQGPRPRPLGLVQPCSPCPIPEMSSRDPSDPTTTPSAGGKAPTLPGAPNNTASSVSTSTIHRGPDRCPSQGPPLVLPSPSSHSMDADADRMGSAGLFPLPPGSWERGRKQPPGGDPAPTPPAGWEVLAKPSRRLFSDASQRLGPGVLQANLGTQPRFLSTGHLPGSKRPGLCLSIPCLSIYLTTGPLVPRLSVHPASICLSTSIC